MYDNILLPIDRGYESTMKAVKESIKIADKFDSVIHIMYVQLEEDEIHPDKEDIEPIEEMKEFFENTSIDNEIRYIVKKGKPIDEICTYVNEEYIDLIIMTTHRRGLIGKVTLGSLTDDTIQNTECPVLVMKMDT